jgi:N-acetylmuramoyl-L-alanine amidase
LLGLVLLCWPARTLRSDSFIFYSPNSRHIIPLQVIQSTKYLPLLQILNLIGKVNGLQEKRNTLQVGFGNTQINLRADDRIVRIGKWTTVLTSPVRISNGQWMTPTDFLTMVVPRLTHQTVEYQVGTNRVFVGDVKPSSFVLRLDQLAGGARLTFRFTDKITVRTASVNGRWVMFLGDHPVEPLEQSFHFQNPYVSDITYDDQDGAPKLIITPAAEGLNFYPVLSEDGKALLAEVLKPAPPVPQLPHAPQPPAAPRAGATPIEAPSAEAGAEEAPATEPGPPLPVVALDAGHGGGDAGTHGNNGVTEKDVVAQLVGRIRMALLSTRKYRVILTRAGDAGVTFEQRAAAANVAGAAYFLTFHAGDLGGNSPRVAVYTYQPPGPARVLPEGEARFAFIPWNQVQNAYLDQSRQFCETLQQQFAQMGGVVVDSPAGAPIRTLRSVNAPAVAIEIGNLTPENDPGQLTNPEFQDRISAAVAQVLAGLKSGGD